MRLRVWRLSSRKRAEKVISGLTRIGAAWLNTAYINRFTASYNSIPRPKYRVLCLEQAIFNDDIQALAVRTESFLFLEYPRWAAKIIFQTFIPRGSEESDEHRYPLIEDTSPRARRYNRYARRFWSAVLRRNRVDAVVVANFPYCFQQELMRVCRDKGVAFVVLHKEGMAVDYDRYVEMYATQRFRGHSILFYNRLIRDAVLKKGIDGITEDNTSIVGIPRLDEYAGLSEPNESRKHVVLFSFRPLDKFKHLAGGEEEMKRLIEESYSYHKAFLEMAVKHPEYDFTVKTKKTGGSVEYIEDILKEVAGERPGNVEITDEISPQALIGRASVVTGFNSTTLIEAVVARRKIVTADFRALLSVPEYSYFDRYKTLANFATSAGLQAQVLQLLRSDENLDSGYEDERERFIEERVYKADGLSSRRALDALANSISTVQGQRSGAAGA